MKKYTLILIFSILTLNLFAFSKGNELVISNTPATHNPNSPVSDFYPDYSYPTTANSTGMSSSSKVLAAKMFVGWNLGNSLEVPGNETGWGNPETTQALIDSVKAAGINAIRIPCAWNSYIEDTVSCKLKASWLNRVKEVVDYCYKNEMYVILNIHWDGGWLENNPTFAKKVAINAKQKALWQQIAVFFRDYDEHLLFAGTNEVHVNYGTPTDENISVQQSFNQTFVDAVRSTGGRNAFRNLIVQSYNTDIDHAVNRLKIAKDILPDRLMVEVHYYSPWDFCGDAASNIYLWGKDYVQFGAVSNWGQESFLNTQFQNMKTNFVDKGYPVILGEYGAIRRSALTGSVLQHHLDSRVYFYQYITQQAKKYGLVPFVWDNGSKKNNGFAIFDRNTGTVFDTAVLKAYIQGASIGVYPF
jgi:endoglucanase